MTLMLMATDLDRLELELRCVPGVVAVGLDRDDTHGLFVQVIVIPTVAPSDLRDRIRRIVDANIREPVSLEIVVDGAGPVDA
jgi:hypothetical protein